MKNKKNYFDMKVYITKWALTEGVMEREGIIDGKRVYVEGLLIRFSIGDDLFLTPEEAKQKAEEMRVKKIESLKKKIVKLEKLKF